MLKSYLLLVVTVIIFSGNLLVGKAINDLPPFTITFFRCFIAFLVILPIAFNQLRAKEELFRREWKAVVGMSFFGITLFNVLVYSSLNFTTSTNAGIVEATTPIFTIILGVIFLKEQIGKIQLTGMFISLVGAIWVITKGSWTIISQLQFNIGDIIMLLAIISWSIFSILIKQHNSKFPVYGSIAAMLFVSLIILLPFTIIEWYFINPKPFQLKFMLGLLYLGIFPSVIALLFWNIGVADIGPSRASIFLNLLPVFTTIGAVLFLGEQVILAQLLGGVLVITGVLLSTAKVKKKVNNTSQKQEVSITQKQ
ncbi:DMT family transporter [Salirhabdus salicampi]|uniref:DMT family transporter n=1 Tax=Salirhabdus salicampi TaxID=476102 RepID=UPI0020C46D63|nr:DMT family transporter [Salirhabdus salicampi]MCP8617899.1 DMT family transporter [Salirhabdus salicampi]